MYVRERKREGEREREEEKCVCKKVCAAASEGERPLAVGTDRAEIPFFPIGSLQILRSYNAPHLQHRALHLCYVPLAD